MTYTYRHACTHTHRDVRVHRYAHRYMASRPLHTTINIESNTNPYTRDHIWSSSTIGPTQPHVNTHTHTHTHIHTHTHTHTYIHTLIESPEHTHTTTHRLIHTHMTLHPRPTLSVTFVGAHAPPHTRHPATLPTLHFTRCRGDPPRCDVPTPYPPTPSELTTPPPPHPQHDYTLMTHRKYCLFRSHSSVG